MDGDDDRQEKANWHLVIFILAFKFSQTTQPFLPAPGHTAPALSPLACHHRKGRGRSPQRQVCILVPVHSRRRVRAKSLGLVSIGALWLTVTEVNSVWSGLCGENRRGKHPGPGTRWILRLLLESGNREDCDGATWAPQGRSKALCCAGTRGDAPWVDRDGRQG